ncbi:MAG: ATP-binding cassette domain-containing protein [Spirochaetes bacterium]|jgi:branched-chain amino acid transport system ATP-binding protein|nr:ATP-binding cassette domain-containing protein [Spirochaetota bacterium]
MLRVDGLDVWYDHVHALDQVDLEVDSGSITAIIGANGAGKTTLLNTISGLVKPRSGAILLEGKPLPAQAHRIVNRGIVQVPEGRRIFAGLSVRENLVMGAFKRREGMRERIEEMFQRFPRLGERRDQQAGTLSGGEQQMLAVCRGLMARPRLLLLDEPSLGLAPVLVTEVFQLIESIRDMGITIALVEQNARKALTLADRAFVLESGALVLSGTGHELLDDPKVRDAYLGSSDSGALRTPESRQGEVGR